MVPTLYGDTEKPIRTRHHRVWDQRVRKITGGLTIGAVSKGQWVNPEDGKLWEERIIPVQIACTDEQMQKIVSFSLTHYRQQAIMFAVLSDQVFIVNKSNNLWQ